MTATGDTEIETAIEIPQVFKYHAFACHTQRPPGHPRASCGSLGGSRYGIDWARNLRQRGSRTSALPPQGVLGFARLVL